jgi:diaminohydroxyphosphoribosylaminopyrimidine deaminase/5-amino-6-(5-phosphoribosylamino)uracil reductase
MNALPVLLDTQLSCPIDARVLHAGRKPVIYCADDAPTRDISANVCRVPRHVDGGVDLKAVLADLVSRDVHTVLVEGGAQVNRSFLDANLVDQVHLFVAPKILAGGPGWVGGAPFVLAQAPQLRVMSTRPVGDDLCVILERTPDPAHE